MPLWLDGKMNVINLEYGNDPLLNSVAALWFISLIAQLTHGVSLFFLAALWFVSLTGQLTHGVSLFFLDQHDRNLM